jgi:hypothetical protein
MSLLAVFLAFPMLLPLSFPVLSLMWLLWASRSMMTTAVSQLAEEAAGTFGMQRVDHEC